MVVVDDFPAFDRPQKPVHRAEFLGTPFDRISFDDVLTELRHSRSGQSARYVVTPNVDHVVRFSRDRDLAHIYRDAWLSLCDSRPIWTMSRYLKVGLDHVTGSDLTDRMFGTVLHAGDAVAVVVANEAIAGGLILKYPDLIFHIHVPPPQVAENPDAFGACVDFLLSRPFRFAFVAIGSPQSESIAHEWSRRPGATGTALCIGASLEFVVGLKTRAPRWMRAAGLEWLHRLISEPRRLWRRYALGVFPLFRLFLHQIRRPGMKEVEPN